MDWVTLNSGVETPSQLTTNLTFVPPYRRSSRGWVIAPNSEVILTAAASTVTPRSSWQTSALPWFLNVSSEPLSILVV